VPHCYLLDALLDGDGQFGSAVLDPGGSLDSLGLGLPCAQEDGRQYLIPLFRTAGKPLILPRGGLSMFYCHGKGLLALIQISNEGQGGDPWTG
jgi:hypothetical protein